MVPIRRATPCSLVYVRHGGEPSCKVSPEPEFESGKLRQHPFCMDSGKDAGKCLEGVPGGCLSMSSGHLSDHETRLQKSCLI